MSATHTTARGLRDNNPGNLRDAGIPWQGLVGHDDLGFCIFDTPHNGMRALSIDLHTKWKRGLNTIARIIPVYAPPNENDTAAYETAVCSSIGRAPDDVLNLNDLNELAKLTRAIVLHENGSVPYAATEIVAASKDALVGLA